MDTYRITEQCKQLLQDHYGNRFAGLVLYGSMARDDASPDSDVDLLVLLNESFNYFWELRIIVELFHPIEFSKHSGVIAAFHRRLSKTGKLPKP